MKRPPSKPKRTTIIRVQPIDLKFIRRRTNQADRGELPPDEPLFSKADYPAVLKLIFG